MIRIWKSVTAGVIGGLAGAFAMNGFQRLLSVMSNGTAPDQDAEATIKTARAIARNVFHRELTGAQQKWGAPVVHYSMGAGFGAAYGVLAEKVPTLTAGFGLLYGTAVWLVADEIAVPVFGFAQGPAEYSLGSHVNALASHLVYGVAMDLARRLLIRY